MNWKKIKKGLIGVGNGVKENVPMIIGILLLINMLKNTNFFDLLQNQKDGVFSVLLADVLGSISASNPINSYIIVKQIGLTSQNIVMITTFLVAWVTVGLIQLPAEMYFLGKKFAIRRNFLSFVFAILAGLFVKLIYTFF